MHGILPYSASNEARKWSRDRNCAMGIKTQVMSLSISRKLGSVKTMNERVG